MDYLIGFLAGYYWYIFIQFLRRISDKQILEQYEEDFNN